MAYIGTPPQSGFITTAKQRVTGSTNNYVDLDHSISSLADVIVWVNSVKQDSTNLTLTTSTRITLGGTLVSSDVCEISFLGKAVATQTPDNNTITNDMLVGSIANSKLATDPLNASNLASGTVPTARLGSGTASSSTFLRGDSTFAEAGGTNKGFFYVYKASLNVASATNTIVTGWSETFDLDNWFASDKYTPQEAGKYVFFYSARSNNIGATARFFVALKKNGAGLDHAGAETNIVSASYPSLNAAFVVDMNGSSDYIQSEIYHNQGSTSNFFDIYLQGFKLIT